MKRIGITSLAWSAALLIVSVSGAFATPLVNGATIETRTFNDCPISTVTTTNNYPSSIEITDAMHPACVGFANLHSFSFSQDGGATAAVFNNNSNFRFSADFRIDGAGEGEGGLRISPWYGKFVDGRFMANASSGEIACFGGAIPFYSFTGNHGISYTKGTTIRLEVTYGANDLTAPLPATIQYRVVYNGNTYDSPVLQFGQQNPVECDPNGLFGMLNDGRAGGYFQARANTAASLTATWSNIEFECLLPTGTPIANAATIETRTFNDCPISTVTTTNNYPSSVEITDEMHPACVGFANLHGFSFSEDGGTTAASFDNNARFRFGADFKIDGAGEGEGGMRISPWYGKFVDGRFMANAGSGEIACFGGAIPFYSFTGNHGISYTKGTTIRLEVAYDGNDNVESDPATIQYRVIYNGNTYDSPVLPFGKQNAVECSPNGLWGMLNDGRAGGYFQARANTGASLTATWSNITYSPCAAGMEVSFNPNVLNLGTRGRWVTVYLEPAAGLSASDIDVSSILLNGSVAVAAGAPSVVGDQDEDGTPDLAVKFDRSEVAALLAPGNAVPITVGGSIACECFEGTDVIRVTQAKLASPAAGSVLASGSQVDVQWDPDNDPAPVDLISSFDGGATWNIEAHDVPNTGSHSWTVPDVSTSQALLAIVDILSESESDIVMRVELSASETFAIQQVVGVGDGSLRFGMAGIAPNPTHGEFTVSFTLPSGAAATLAVYDITGRQVASQEVSGLGVGAHAVTFGRREALPAGVYQVRLSQDGRSLVRRAVVMQ